MNFKKLSEYLFISGPKYGRTGITYPDVVYFQQIKTVIIGDSSIFENTCTIFRRSQVQFDKV